MLPVPWLPLLASQSVSLLGLPASGQEHELLELLLESLTLGVEARGGPEKWLRSRTWWEMSHVGNRPVQARSYYDMTRRIAPKLICEIGLNGGHSAAIFLAAAGPSSKLVMFDTMAFSYSNWTVHVLEQLFPGQLTLIRGDSTRQVPAYFRGQEASCDLFSVDGDHRYRGVKSDILNAIAATKRGGVLLLDDMQRNHQTRRGFDEVVASGKLSQPTCQENVHVAVSHIHRRDTSSVRTLSMDWCTATVI